MRSLRVAGVAALTAAVLSPVASAHVSVLPSQAVLRQSTQFTVRVPSEGVLTTTAVRVAFPKQVTVYAVADVPGWTSRLIRRPDGRLAGVEWSGGTIPPDHYADFTMLGTPFQEGLSVWPSWQGTEGGVVKRWTGPPQVDGTESPETRVGARGPASAVRIVADAPGETVPAAGTAAERGGSDGAGIWLGVIGIALAAGALAGVGVLWSSRPGALPPDGPGDGARR